MSISCDWIGKSAVPLKFVGSISIAGVLGLYIVYCRWSWQRRDDFIRCLASDVNNRDSLWQAFHLITINDLTFEFQISLETRGLLSTYGVPSISSVLKSTGGFERDVQRRYADMSVIIAEFLENNVHNNATHEQRARIAIQRLNAIHDKYYKLILHRDMLYVLSVFMITPCELCDSRWSTRQLSLQEKNCIFLHYMEIGRQMNIDVDLHWNSYDQCFAFKKKYEEKFLVYSKSNRDIAFATIDYFLQTFPSWLQPSVGYMVLHILSSMQETPRHREALGLPNPNPAIVMLTDLVLTTRALFCRYLWFPRPGWEHRISGREPIPLKSLGDEVQRCPYQRYFTSRPLDFGNTTYTMAGSNGKSYAIEQLGPIGIADGLLCEKPRYKYDSITFDSNES